MFRRLALGPVAQLAARLAGSQEVTGSTPVRSTELSSVSHMSFIPELVRKKLYRLKHLLRANYYFYPQMYDCLYEVVVKNNCSDSQNITVVFPVPQTMFNQTITNVLISESGDILEEKKYNNKYYASSIKLRSNEEKKITLSFRAGITPIEQRTENLVNILDRAAISYNRFIQETKPIKDLSQTITSNYINTKEKVGAIYDYVIAHLTYGDQITGLYTATQALELPCVDCGGYVTLLSSLLKNITVSCVPIFGFFANHTIGSNQKNSMHAWGYIPLQNNKIYPVDPSEDYLYRHGQSYKSGGFGWVGSDRVIFSQGCDFEILVDGKKETADILQNARAYPTNSDIEISTVFKTTIKK